MELIIKLQIYAGASNYLLIILLEVSQEARTRGGSREGVEGDIPGTILIEVGLIMIMFQYFIKKFKKKTS